MSVDYTKIELSSSASSNKVLKEGTSTSSVAALVGAGETQSTATIPHSYGNDNLIAQVTTIGGPTDGVILPWSSGDNRIIQYHRLDSSNLYITFISSDSSGLGASAFTITYYYRVLIP